MDIELELRRFIYHPKVREYYDLFKTVDKQGYPSMSYFGINFNEQGICSFKFYFGFFNRLEEKDIANFLPHTRDLNKYYHLWQPSHVRDHDNSGCTFEVKFKADLTPVYGFHFRVPPSREAYDLIGHPTQLPFKVEDTGHYPGINYEYCGEDVLRKRYYYISKPSQKKYIADRFGIPFANDAEILEYTETDEYAKVNVWRFDHNRSNLNRPKVLNEYALKVVEYIKERYGLINISEGYYEHSDIRATYFFNTINGSNAPFSEPENSTIDTLRLFYP